MGPFGRRAPGIPISGAGWVRQAAAGFAAGFAVMLVAALVPTVAFASPVGAPGSSTFAVPGGPYPFVVPVGVTTVHVVAVGGTGGSLEIPGQPVGGRGAVVSADLSVAPGSTLDVFVAGNGAVGAAGINGGGIPRGGNPLGGGGGSSDIRPEGGSLASRLLVAAGGGGGSAFADGGAAGQPGNIGGNCPDPAATPGSQTAGGTGSLNTCDHGDGEPGLNGTFGIGGASGYRISGNDNGGAGGGGWYGGGGGNGYGGGAGGSNLVPAGGTASTDTTGEPKVTISYSPAALAGGSRLAVTPDESGWCVLNNNGTVTAYGDATDYGSPASQGVHLNKPAVGIASTPDGHGYWIVASDGECSPTVTLASTARPATSTSTSRSSG